MFENLQDQFAFDQHLAKIMSMPLKGGGTNLARSMNEIVNHCLRASDADSATVYPAAERVQALLLVTDDNVSTDVSTVS